MRMVSRINFNSFLFLCLLLFFTNSINGQIARLGFNETLRKNPNETMTFCLPNDSSTCNLLKRNAIPIKYYTKTWLFVSCTPYWVNQKLISGELSDFYFEFSPPMALSDTAVYRHHASEVHQGSGGLKSSYTGRGVIVGIIDQGLDWKNPDFIDPNGKTRVLRYWDQSSNTGGKIPKPYNYGIVWDSSDINSGICTSTEESTAHGTTVSGIAAGNGRANGTNKGFAPESDLIIVETKFGVSNWTLTIADACDYIFKVADSLGKPAVINISVGTYLGSHDGNDPASEYIEKLLTEKNGRVVVSAAGNSGAWGKYHVHGDIDADTSFVWMKSNPSNFIAPNAIYMDLWTDISDTNWQFALGANRSTGNYEERATTKFRKVTTNMGGAIFDTLRNGVNRIATVEIYPYKVGQNLNVQILFRKVDSTAYYYSLKTTGSGSFDAWTGSSNSTMNLTDMVSTIPSKTQYKPIVHYFMPDSLQTIVTSWNCSEKVISVGNVKNRVGHFDKNGNYYGGSTDNIAVGQLGKNSSKGPNRGLLIKPDVAASGDISLGSAPLWMVNNPIYNASLDVGGWHARNGGTSMASPCVAGIAALYLEKCNTASYATFKNDLIQTATKDQFTGNTPNNAYGFGKPNALNLLLLNQHSTTVSGDSTLCIDPIQLSIKTTSVLSSAVWSNESTGLTLLVSEPGGYSAKVVDFKGCTSYTDTLIVNQLEVLPMKPIIRIGDTLIAQSLSNYQWTLNGEDITGETKSTLVIHPPYGTYTCYCVSADGCVTETEPFTVIAGLTENLIEHKVYPIPSSDELKIETVTAIKDVQFKDAMGRIVQPIRVSSNSWSINSLSKGVYDAYIETTNKKFHVKIVRM
jgi:hypothetical protein